MRHLVDRLVKGSALLSVGLMAAALVIVLGPILWRGFGAVFFRGTYEFRRREFEVHGRGRPDRLADERAAVDAARKPVYDLIEAFKADIVDVNGLSQEARRRYNEFRDQIPAHLDRPEHRRFVLQLRQEGRRLRDALEEAYATTDREAIRRHLVVVRTYDVRAAFDDQADSVPAAFLDLVRDYQSAAERFEAAASHIDLRRVHEYAAEIEIVEAGLRELFGPREGEAAPNLQQFQYGAPRWDMVRRILDDLLWVEEWTGPGPGQALERRRVPRAAHFEGTVLAGLFPLLEQRAEAMVRPRRTFYWRFFTDDSTPGLFFGGVGPEILGTLLLTVMAMVFALPIGVVTAAYLVEVTRENLFIRAVRMCINTLAGVPSIVFGLFGLAFFVMTVKPLMGLPAKPSILAGSMTLAALILPVIIRASEEAIRAVPSSYKEASLAVGAGGFTTFIKVTLPASLPGILTGVILSMSRAAGETAPLLFTAAIFVGPVPASLLDQTRTLSYGGYFLAVGDNIAPKVPHNRYGIVMALVLLVLLLNVAAILIRSRVARRLRGQ